MERNRKRIHKMEITFCHLETEEDLKRLIRVAEVIWPETYKEILSGKQITYMMEMMYAPKVLAQELANGYSFILCTVDGKDAGYLSFSPSPDEKGAAKLHKVYLLHSCHGKGIGQKMLSYACACCKEKGFSSVYLTVNKKNLKAQKAYLKYGFTVEKAVCCDIGENFVMDDFVMRKML